MEASRVDGLLYLHQITDQRDQFILKVVGQGLELIYASGNMTEDEAGLRQRVQGALAELHAAEWQGRADFPLTIDEAKVARAAIRQATNAELRSNGKIVERSTAVASASIAGLTRYIGDTSEAGTRPR